MEVVAPARVTAGRFRADLDLADLALPGDEQRDVWNLRLGGARKGYRLGTHFDGIPNRNEASEYPAAQVGGRRIQPYYTVENNVSVRSETGGEEEPAGRPARPSPRWPGGCSGRPRSSCTGWRCGSRRCRRGSAKPDGRDVRILVLHAWGMGGTVRAAHEPGGVAGRERPLGRDRQRRPPRASGRSSRSPTA